MNGAEVLITFKGNTKDVDKSVQKVDASVGSIAKGTVVATGITKAFSAAWGMVTKNMDTAIDRYDTLSNFSNVMKNLGISAEDSQKAIEKMADKLTGLPTTLQDGAMAVQRLTAKNSDIKKSTDLFLAMNNAILAGGAPLANQQAALEQLTQAYSKGKMDMMEWRTIQTAMPAQLKQIAKAMGYSTEELGEMMRQGDQTQETMDKFTDTMMQLNEKGLDGFGNLEEQARSATGGVRTAITNMNSRIAQGITAMIEGVDKGLQDANLGTLANIFENIGNTIREALKKTVPYIVKTISYLSKMFDWMSQHKTLVKTIAVSILAIISAIKIWSIVTGILTTAVAFLNAVMSINPITLIILAIIALVAAFVYLWNKCEWFKNFWIGLWEKIKLIAAGVVDWFKALPENIGKLVENIKNFFANLPYYIGYALGFIVAKLIKFYTVDVPNFVNGIIKWFKELPGKIWNSLVSAFLKFGIWLNQMAIKAKEAIPKLVNNIINWFKNLPGRMKNIGTDIVKGIWNGIKNAGEWLKKQIKGFGKGIVDGVKKALKIGSPSKVMAQEVGQWIPKGIGVGITANTDAVNKSMSNMQKEMMSTFQVSPQLANSAALHYSPTVVNNVQVNMTQDPLGQMVRDVKTFSGGSKNDYNYGMGV